MTKRTPLAGRSADQTGQKRVRCYEQVLGKNLTGMPLLTDLHVQFKEPEVVNGLTVKVLPARGAATPVLLMVTVIKPPETPTEATYFPVIDAAAVANPL